jgi:hypothetical protein
VDDPWLNAQGQLDAAAEVLNLDNGCRVPVVAIDAAMAVEAVREGERIGIVATNPTTLEPSGRLIEVAAVPFTSRRREQAVRLIIRRVIPTPGSQLALLGIGYTYHAFITDREGNTLELEVDHRRHAEIENTIRDVKYVMALNHMPSSRFAANAA